MILSILIALVFNSISVPADAQVRYYAPSQMDWEQLTPEEKNSLEAQLNRLNDDEFINRPGIKLVRPSGYIDPGIQAEALRIAQFIVERHDQYSKIVFVGRSGTGIMNVVQGALAANNVSSNIDDLPFSVGQSDHIDQEAILGLKKYLKAKGLTPRQVAKLEKPILFVDIVFEGKGVFELAGYIQGNTKKDREAARIKMDFLGLFSPEGLAEFNLIRMNALTAAEFRQAPKYPTETEIKAEALRSDFPRSLSERFQNILKFNVSRELFFYLGNQAPLYQESLTVRRWATASTTGRGRISGESLKHPGVLEAYFLYQLGQKLKLPLKLQTCREGLGT